MLQISLQDIAIREMITVAHKKNNTVYLKHFIKTEMQKKNIHYFKAAFNIFTFYEVNKLHVDDFFKVQAKVLYNTFLICQMNSSYRYLYVYYIGSLSNHRLISIGSHLVESGAARTDSIVLYHVKDVNRIENRIVGTNSVGKG